MYTYSLISSFGSSYFTVFKRVHMLAVVWVFVNVLVTRLSSKALHLKGIQECPPL
jgi:hypothetical protein